MLKSIIRTMLTSAMGFAWSVISTGEHLTAFAERWGADDQYAGFTERRVRTWGMNVTAVGERLELRINRFATGLGYTDGEVSGIVAWPA